MSDFGKHIVLEFQNRWLVRLGIQIVLYGLGVAVLIYALSKNWMATIASFLLITIALIILKKPWEVSVQKTSQYLDAALSSMENSTGLLLIPESELSSVALLQRHKIAEKLQSDIGQVQSKVSIQNAMLIFLGFVVFALLINYLDIFEKIEVNRSDRASEENIIFQPIDSLGVKSTPPMINAQNLTIKYPRYTKLAARTSSDMNVKALEGSTLYWNIEFDKEVDSVFMEKGGLTQPMKGNSKSYTETSVLKGSGFYNFKYLDIDGASFISDLYAMEVLQDEVPKIEIQKLKQFSTFEIDSEKKMTLNTIISDDFGIAETHIIATVTKGEGESVKFREERLAFENGFSSGSKKVNLHKTIDLDALKMEAGDELYFYVEVIDTKQPKANRSRSETYFAVIRDTVTNQFAVEGTMGADLMPDYFRSQRQLIIDTEKLIADKNKISKNTFNATSNELGYDQKALRLKYGAFMGDEVDSGIQVTQEIEVEEEQSADDPLQEYTHDHDGSNEHNLVDHDHEEKSPATEKESPLDDYLHNHDDPEEATLFTQSLKGKLRQAMSEMWDAELHLRLYTPENSLPYQYRALKLIQEIKNSARIYVHRIGFDPPPIKEDKRLTGEITTVKTFQKVAEVATEDNAKHLREAVTRISKVLDNQLIITETDRQLFRTAGNELAALAIENPGSYLHTLQRLKWLSERKQTTKQELIETQSGLLIALPSINPNPSKADEFEVEINTLMLKEIDINE